MSVLDAVRRQPRLLVSVALAASTFVLLPRGLDLQTRWIISWDVGVVVFLASAWAMMVRAGTTGLQGRAARGEQNRVPILALSVIAAGFSLFATGYELHTARMTDGAGWRIGIAALTVLLSWAFTQTVFAIAYAHEWYEDPAHPRLIFPGGELPDYTDFLYYAFVVGMTFQVSDVQIAERWMRRLTTIHGVLSFLFNTVILALAVNLTAGLF